MTTSDNEAKGPKSRSIRLWLLIVLVAVLLPAFGLLSALAVILATNNLDPAFVLGVSDSFLNGLLVASSGALSGLVVGLVSRLRGWGLVLPSLAGLLAGLGIFSVIAAMGSGEQVDNHLGLLATIWVGQGAGIVLATRLSA